MKVSVLIPTWNSEKYIGRAIRSILSAGWGDLEIIIVDKLSDDKTKEIVRGFKDKRIIFDSKKDKSLYDGLNRGIKQAKGEIVAWIGADDRYNGKAISLAVKALSKSKKNWLVGGGKFVYEDGSGRVIEHRVDQKLSATKLISKNQLISPSAFFRKDFYLKHKGFDLRYKLAADYDLWLKFAISEAPLVLDKSLSLFSYNPNSFSSTRKVDMYRETISILNKPSVRKFASASFVNRTRLRAYITYNLVKNFFQGKRK